MTHQLLTLAILAIGLVALTLVACGPAASPGSAPPVQSQGDTTTPTDTPAKTPAKTPTGTVPATDDTDTTRIVTPAPTQIPGTLRPGRTRLPTKTPEKPPRPEGTATPLPQPGERLSYCQNITLLSPVNEQIEYMDWCAETLSDHIDDTCSGEPGADAQIACADNILASYKSFTYKLGPWRCAALESGTEDIQSCLTRSAEDTDKGYEALFEAWGEVRYGGDRDARVVTALKDVTTCLSDAGYPDVNVDLLFNWQRADHPHDHKTREERLTDSEKTLRSDLVEPSRDCAKKNGLYTAQEAAWTDELNRLHRMEPRTVQILIDEGLLDALGKPGASVLLTGEQPS